MDAAEQKTEYEKLITRAKKAGLLKFEHEGVAVIELPPSPTAPESAATAMPGAASSSGFC